MRNRYPGNCLVCGEHVAPGEGFFQKLVGTGRWLVRCVKCVGKGNKSIAKPEEQ